MICLQVTSIYALKAAEILKKRGVNIKVLHLSSMKPINKNDLMLKLKGVKNIFVIEDHNIIGGAGSAISDILMSLNFNAKVIKIGINDRFGKSGKAEDLFYKFKLDENSIVRSVQKNLS